MKSRSLLLVSAAALGGVIARHVYQRYQRDRHTSLTRLRAQSDILETSLGSIEYAEEGVGPAVLVSHGAGGGFDQCLYCINLLSGTNVRFVAPSRFGYLRTPLPSNPTPEAQADAFAALLDSLGVEKAAVMGFSAGGMAALQFALRHPDRCRGLILVSAITRPLAVSTPGAQRLGGAMLSNDFVFWAMSTYLRNLILASTGFSAADRARLAVEPHARRGMYGVLDFDPVTHRRGGMLNDIAQAAAFPICPLERISAPTLIVHGTADPLVPFHLAALAANAIPQARFLILEGAGHLGWFTHAAQTRPAAREFFAAHAP